MTSILDFIPDRLPPGIVKLRVSDAVESGKNSALSGKNQPVRII